MKHRFLVSCAVFAGTLGFAVQAHAFHSSLIAFPTASGSIAYVSTKEASKGAEKFITKLADQGIAVLANQDASEAKQKKEFRRLLNNNFDMNTIARFSLGRHWRTASKAQRAEYLKLFNAMIIDVYSARFSDYQGQIIEVKGSRKEGERDVLVHSLLTQEAGPDVKVDWRVRNRDGRYKVIDVIVEGVSMALTQRSDFSSVVQRGGGDMEALLAHLREN